jgi:hypothetical protein
LSAEDGIDPRAAGLAFATILRLRSTRACSAGLARIALTWMRNMHASERSYGFFLA